MITEIKSNEELCDTLTNKFWSTYKLVNLNFNLLENDKDLKVDFGFYDGEGDWLKDKHEVYHLSLTLVQIKEFEVNFVDKPSLIELVTYLQTNKEQYLYIRFDPTFNDFKLAFVFGNSEDIRFLRTEFEWEKIFFEKHASTSKPVKKFLSKDVITIELKKELVPTAAQIKSFFKKNDVKIYFTEYWGDELSVREIRQNLNGVFLKDSLNKRNAGIKNGIEHSETTAKWILYNISDNVAIWDLLLNSFLSKINYDRILCGNVFFRREQWEDQDYKSSFNEMSTYET